MAVAMVMVIWAILGAAIVVVVTVVMTVVVDFLGICSFGGLVRFFTGKPAGYCLPQALQPIAYFLKHVFFWA